MINQKGSLIIPAVVTLAVLAAVMYLFFNKSIPSKSLNTKVSNPQPASSSVSNIDDLQSSLLYKCGDVPEDVTSKINRGHFDQVKGPLWSEDCKYIVWSKWTSGTGGPGVTPQASDSHLSEGVYLYIPSIQEHRTIYKPQVNNETPVLINIENNRIEYKTNDTVNFFDLESIK